MSFLVVYNGQFSPLVHTPSAPGQTRVPTITALEHLESGHLFKDILEEVSLDDKPKRSLKQFEAYKKIEKTYETQKKRLYARDIMASPVTTISQNNPAIEAQGLLKKFNFRHLPVLNENGIIVGMISDRETSTDLNSKSCKEIMLQKVIVCEDITSINEIAIILLKEKINALPIVNHQRNLVGIITLSDILKYVVESTPFLGKG